MILPDVESEEQKSITKRLVESVSSFGTFSKVSLFPLILGNSFSEDTTTVSEAISFVNMLASNANGSRSLDNLRQIVLPFLNTKLSNNDNYTDVLFNQSNSFVKNTAFEYLVDGLKPITKTDVFPVVYLENMNLVCSHVFYVLYYQFYKKFEQSEYTNFPIVTQTNIRKICSNLSANISENVAFYPDIDTMDDFLIRCYNSIYDVKLNTSTIIKNEKCELFAVAFLPYFMLLYFSKFISEKNIIATNKAPRDFVIRRVSTECVYIMHIYILYGIYKLSARFSPSSEETYQMRLLLDATVINVFDTEKKEFDSDTNIIDLHNNIKNIFDKNDDAQAIHTKIDYLNNATITIQHNLDELNKKYKGIVILKWLWFELLLVFLAFIIGAMYCKFSSSAFENQVSIATYMFSCIILILLVVLSIINISKRL